MHLSELPARDSAILMTLFIFHLALNERCPCVFFSFALKKLLDTILQK